MAMLRMCAKEKREKKKKWEKAEVNESTRVLPDGKASHQRKGILFFFCFFLGHRTAWADSSAKKDLVGDQKTVGNGGGVF